MTGRRGIAPAGLRLYLAVARWLAELKEAGRGVGYILEKDGGGMVERSDSNEGLNQGSQPTSVRSCCQEGGGGDTSRTICS